MSFSRQRDFLFCDICGTLLSLESVKYSRCPLCKTKRKAKELCGKEISYTVSAEDIRRELGIPQLINPDGVYTEEVEVKQQGTLVSKVCGNCYHQGMLKITSAQLRSADEGETTFYECPECRIRTSD
ncbi:hypothetical protein QQ045_013273 [Rhodiola kirilowii]